MYAQPRKVLIALLGIFAFDLISIHAASATDCSDLFRRQFDNEFRIFSSRANQQEIAKFLSNPSMFDSPPKNMMAQIEDKRGVRVYATGSIIEQPKDIRRLFNDIRHRSSYRKNGDDVVVEFGAILIEFENGTTMVSKVTSRVESHIEGGDLANGLMFNLAKNEARNSPIKRAIVIHSHVPGQGQMPSVQDYQSLAAIRLLLSASGGNPKIQGIILPLCQSCDDLFIVYTPSGFTRKAKQ